MTGSRIGVVLSSGGARGVYAHTGFLLALEDIGIAVSASAGCSAGAVVGGIAASGADIHVWSETLAHLDSKRFWTPNPWPRLAWQLAARRGRGYTGLSGTEAAVEFCRSEHTSGARRNLCTRLAVCRNSPLLLVWIIDQNEFLSSRGSPGPSFRVFFSLCRALCACGARGRRISPVYPLGHSPQKPGHAAQIHHRHG